jgi:2'-hydroxyisoflavone reductase
MRILLIGGPSFIGLHIIEQALVAGHEVTMFNRGRTNAGAYPEVERIQGDRTRAEDLRALSARDWDAVVDTCGYDHRVVALSVDALRGRAGHYTFISSIGVYRDFSAPRREGDPLAPLVGDPDVPVERPYGGSAHYGPMKALSEARVAEAWPDRWLAVRLTLGVGPRDHGDTNARLAYWAKRMRDHERVLCPGPPDRLMNYIDMRDMTAWIIASAGRGVSGAFNLAAPARTFADFLEQCRELLGGRARVEWVDPEWLLAQGVAPNTELPIWTPWPGFEFQFAVDAGKAVAAGLHVRPLAETVRASIDWDDAYGIGRAAPGGVAIKGLLTGAREEELLARWDSLQP